MLVHECDPCSQTSSAGPLSTQPIKILDTCTNVQYISEHSIIRLRRIVMDFSDDRDVVKVVITSDICCFTPQMMDDPTTSCSYQNPECCPDCGGPMIHQSGCNVCLHCGYSPCD
jgi:hypothetical protein